MWEVLDRNTMTFKEGINLMKKYKVSVDSLDEKNFEEVINKAINEKYKKFLKDFVIGDEFLITNETLSTRFVKLERIRLGKLIFKGYSGQEYTYTFSSNKDKKDRFDFSESLKLEQIVHVSKESLKELNEKNYVYKGARLNLHNICVMPVYSLFKKYAIKKMHIKNIKVENEKTYYYFSEEGKETLIKHTLKDFTLFVEAQDIVGEKRCNNFGSPDAYYRTFRPIVKIHNHFKEIDEFYVYDDSGCFNLVLNAKINNKEELKYIKNKLENHKNDQLYFDINFYDLKKFKKFTKKDFNGQLVEDGIVYVGEKWYYIDISYRKELCIEEEILTKTLFGNTGFSRYKYFKYKKNAVTFLKEQNKKNK